ncbi:ABC transporter permease subunit [Phytomonospora endophytica]|uniref:ABC-2 type transport system permease protein n=1 Tax=Phytomonospora endophytica TaxID=714109 RepID=A0A841FI44_9ACTN|nr:ABC transporter permease subunit [Phytomonospora endophytica]MBB6035534.1 ABC-2 type transport system permease protein [Phytomonospora endophytica]GIG70103.1 ABC transporter permease [Phytomonospora endophytica]
MRVMRSEWTKLRTLSSTGWLLAGAVLATIAVSVTGVLSVDTSHCPTPAECFEDTVRLSLGGIRFGQVVVVILAVLAVSGEYATGTIRATLTANPRRLTVLAGKAAVLAATVAAAGVLGVLGSLLAGRLILPGNGFSETNGYAPLSLTDGPTLRAATGSVLYLVLIALLALGFALIIRDTAGTITTVFALLFVAPVVGLLVTDPEWREKLDQLTPMTAGLSVQSTIGLDTMPIGPWPGLGVLAAYAAAALLAGAVLFARRDQ